MNKPSKGLIDLSRASKPALPTEAAASITGPTEGVSTTQSAPEPVAAAPKVTAPEPPTPATAPEEARTPRQREPRAMVATPAPIAAIEPVSTLGARIPVSLHKRVRLFCLEHDVEMQHFVQDALTRHLERLQKGAKAVE